jgi:2-polyprenyl-3-methyl-5-hydroxy-6-metoxy-1,4-benzoquinol methylase
MNTIRAHAEQQKQDHVRYEKRASCPLRHGSATAPTGSCERHWTLRARVADHESQLGEFGVYYCTRCKLGLTEPFPSEDTVDRLYATKASSDFDEMRDSVIDRIKDHLSVRLLKRLAPHANVQCVLDYGTGNGRFAISAAKVFANAQIDAVDYQLEAPAGLRNRTDGVHYHQVSKFWERHRLYDLIVLRHVLEHTHQPVKLLKRLASRLAPDGLIYIEVPNMDAGCARVFGKRWVGYYVPRHIFHYTLDSLAEAARNAGLRAELGRNEMPLMGNTVAILAGMPKSNIVMQCLGVFLHPLQLAIEAWHGSSTCIHARCTHPR